MEALSLTPTRLDCGRSTGHRAAAVNLAALLLAAYRRNELSAADRPTSGFAPCKILGISSANDNAAVLGSGGFHAACTIPDWLQGCASYKETTTDILSDTITKFLTASNLTEGRSAYLIQSFVKPATMALDANTVFQARRTQVGVADEHERVDWDFSIDGL